MSYRLKSLQPLIVALALYAGLTAIMTWPLAAQLGTHIPGLVGDSYVHLWTFEWVKDSLLSGQSPFYTNLLFYPQGVTLVFHNIAWVNILVWLFLQIFISSGAAYTLVHLGVLTFNGFATFLLAREVTESNRASFISGLICAFWPFIMSHQDSPNLIFIAWVSLALLFLRRMFISGAVKDALFVALFLILTGITRWQMLIMAAPLIALYVLFVLIKNQAARSRQMVELLFLIAVVTGFCLLPLMAPVVFGQLTRSNPEDLFVEEQLFATDLLGFIVPSRYHPLWGAKSFGITWQFAGNNNYVPFIGFTTLILALLGVVGARRKSRFWALAGLFYGILALGPFLFINGQSTGIALPYLIIDDWFPVQAIRHPERLNVMLSIPLSILAGLGVTVLFRNALIQKYKNMAVSGLCILVLVEYIITFPTLDLSTPIWYEQAAQETGEFAILDVPMNMRRIFDKQYMYYQETHQRPIIEGHVSRPPREAFDFIEHVPFLQSIRDQRFPPEKLGDLSNQMQILNESGVRYLVLHKEFLRDSHEDAWRSWLLAAPTYEDDAIIVYRTGAMVLGEAYALEQPMVEASEHPLFGLVHANYAPKQTIPGGWVQADIWWGSNGDLSEDYSVCLNLVANGSTIEAKCDIISPERPTSLWEANEVFRTRHLFQVKPEWDSGNYGLTALLKDESGAPAGRDAILGDFLIENLNRSFAEPHPSVKADANWRNLIGLAGYDQTESEESLNLLLYWQALEEIDTSYKFFVHVTDEATGDLVAQVDYIPRSWLYPTDWWVSGEYIADPISVPLSQLPAGNYQVWLGIYDPDTGERLPVEDAAGIEYENRALPLTSISR